jgi:hypothetical protein
LLAYYSVISGEKYGKREESFPLRVTIVFYLLLYVNVTCEGQTISLIAVLIAFERVVQE